MNRLSLFIICSLFSTLSFGQVVRQGARFVEVTVVEDKVTFMKEVPSKKNLSLESNFKILNDWAKVNYGKDPFISSIRYDSKNHEFIAKSRIELLLPADSKGIREKMIMRYRINGFLFQDKCVLEITEITYMYESQDKSKQIPGIMRAEDFIMDDAIMIKDNLQELRINTRKSTLYFLNELSKDFEKLFGI